MTKTARAKLVATAAAAAQWPSGRSSVGLRWLYAVAGRSSTQTATVFVDAFEAVHKRLANKCDAGIYLEAVEAVAMLRADCATDNEILGEMLVRIRANAAADLCGQSTGVKQ